MDDRRGMFFSGATETFHVANTTFDRNNFVSNHHPSFLGEIKDNQAASKCQAQATL